MNVSILFNDNWYFNKTLINETQPDDGSFKKVDVPHDWLIYDTQNLYENGIGWYKKEFIVEDVDKQYVLSFDGVYMNTTIYVNDIQVGEWKYGYSAFEMNMTHAIKKGKNEIVVKVIHESPNSRWYSGAGIYRDVHLKMRGKNYIETNGIYISNKKLTESNWEISISTELRMSENGMIRHIIKHNEKDVELIEKKVQATQADIIVDESTIMVHQPQLWSSDTPNVYQLQTELYIENELIEVVNQNMGFKSIEFDPNEGLFVNGKNEKLNGVCEHHDLGSLGSAFNKVALRRRLNILKDMGVNAIRTAHNMPAKEWMELADEMGFYIVTEAFDMWERPKTTYDYARFFNEWVEKDIESWVRRDRNHPSLIMWGIGNEIYDTHADEKGLKLTKKLMDEVYKHDPKKNAVVTIGSNYMPWENAQKCADVVKIVGYNYGEKYYDEHHQAYKNWVIYGSETASIVQSRGVYHFPFEESILTDDDEQCSALGNSTTSWGAKSVEDCLVTELTKNFSLGQFIWTGFDYIGEPTPYHTKNSYFGQIDTATFQKDSFYLYQATWTDYNDRPMVHIFPYWDFNPGQLIDVRVCSNAPIMRLYLNDQLIGEHTKSQEQLYGTWKIPYEPGVLRAEAWNEKGEIIATDQRVSFGDAHEIHLKTEKNTLLANGVDLLFVEINMKDADGNIVENANNRVSILVNGKGRLVGLDNGDSTDYDQYKGISRRLFNGKLMAIIASTCEAGTIEIEVGSKGLATKIIHLESLPTNKEISGISAFIENKPMQLLLGHKDEIPVRKIEIFSENGQKFNVNNKEMMVRAKRSPLNTTYDDLEWSVVTNKGIETKIAKIESFGDHAKVTALGDGNFKVRCMSKNGSEKIRLISELEFTVEGLGIKYKNPYEFISAGLYDDGIGEITNGNEKGIATSRDGITIVGFKEIDFGDIGSDFITLPIFALTDEVYTIEIWEGKPNESGSEQLIEAMYQKESKWNVYQEESYQLSKRLTGITSLYFVLTQKVHIKGFSFEKENKAFIKNYATECDRIYGDTYTKTESVIKNIGNNVTLEYNQLDFGEEGMTKLIIKGYSPIDKNTIHILFSNETENTKQIVEFRQAESYTTQIFELKNVTGVNDVSFVFLPGSNFDFEWFQFKNEYMS